MTLVYLALVMYVMTTVFLLATLRFLGSRDVFVICLLWPVLMVVAAFGCLVTSFALLLEQRGRK